MPDDIDARVMRTIAETQKIPLESVSLDSTFQQLNIDSLDAINIIFALENEFDISIPDEAAKDIKAVVDVAEAIRRVQSA
jgi:acyl carrier protein